MHYDGSDFGPCCQGRKRFFDRVTRHVNVDAPDAGDSATPAEIIQGAGAQRPA
jgi:hypothetical protein